MNWKNMSISQKIASVIAGLAVVVWLIPKVNPTCFLLIQLILLLRCSQSAKPWSIGIRSESGPIFLLQVQSSP